MPRGSHSVLRSPGDAVSSLEAFELALKELAELVKKVERHDAALIRQEREIDDLSRELTELRARLP